MVRLSRPTMQVECPEYVRNPQERIPNMASRLVVSFSFNVLLKEGNLKNMKKNMVKKVKMLT